MACSITTPRPIRSRPAQWLALRRKGTTPSAGSRATPGRNRETRFLRNTRSGERVMTAHRQDQRLGEIAAKPTFRTIDGVSIRFVESDPRNADALLLSPWPESILAYEPTWSRLAETTHLVAIDLPGFG